MFPAFLSIYAGLGAFVRLLFCISSFDRIVFLIRLNRRNQSSSVLGYFPRNCMWASIFLCSASGGYFLIAFSRDGGILRVSSSALMTVFPDKDAIVTPSTPAILKSISADGVVDWPLSSWERYAFDTSACRASSDRDSCCNFLSFLRFLDKVFDICLVFYVLLFDMSNGRCSTQLTSRKFSIIIRLLLQTSDVYGSVYKLMFLFYGWYNIEVS